MNLTEGIKLTKNLLNQAFSDENITMGFELEFFVNDYQKIIRKDFLRNVTQITDDDGYTRYTKKVKHLTIDDILMFFYPASVSDGEFADNTEIVINRLSRIYQQVAESDKAVPISKMWNDLTQSLGVHTMLAVLRLLPDVNEDAQFNLPSNQADLFAEIIAEGDFEEMTQYVKFNEVDVLLPDEQTMKFNTDLRFSDDIKSSIFNIIADYLSSKLGQPFVSSPFEEHAKSLADNYSKWQITTDASLSERERSQNILGLEVISPVMSVKQGYETLSRMLDILNEGILGSAVSTTYETGLHINIGIKDKEIDAAKLLVLAGDDAILKSFGRTSNTHASSIYKQVKSKFISKFKSQPSREDIMKNISPGEMVKVANSTIRSINQNFKPDMNKVISIIDSIKPVAKGFSINFSKMEQGYVEFRSLGGVKYHTREEEILRSVRNMIAVVYISTNEDAFKREYYKQVYKLIYSSFEEWLYFEFDEETNESVGMIGRGPRGGYADLLSFKEPTDYDFGEIMKRGPLKTELE